MEADFALASRDLRRKSPYCGRVAWLEDDMQEEVSAWVQSGQLLRPGHLRDPGAGPGTISSPGRDAWRRQQLTTRDGTSGRDGYCWRMQT